jgi:hypothetical protein
MDYLRGASEVRPHAAIALRVSCEGGTGVFDYQLDALRVDVDAAVE